MPFDLEPLKLKMAEKGIIPFKEPIEPAGPESEELLVVTNSTNSTNSTGGNTLETAIYPEESVLSMMMDYGRQQSEAPDCYLLGSFLGVVAGCVARKVYYPWGRSRWYPNVYSMLVGLPGDRKSDALQLAAKFAREVLPAKRFLPTLFSKESLFDAYDETQGGTPDKIMLVSDGNILVENWKSGYGEQAGSYFLDLYDCERLTESFKRNKSEDSPSGQRTIEETSTTVIMGTTFSACRFPSRTIQSGMHRRFLFFVSEKRGRIITIPEAPNQQTLDGIQKALGRIARLETTECRMTKEAEETWCVYQFANRRRLDATEDEQERSRLNSSPNHVMKVAMIFAVSCWATRGYSNWDGKINELDMKLAIELVDHATQSASLLDRIANKECIKEKAEAIHAMIQHDFRAQFEDGWIRLSKSQLTSRFCANPNRPGALKTTNLYHEIIPYLIQTRSAKLIEKKGKLEIYGFTPDGY